MSSLPAKEVASPGPSRAAQASTTAAEALPENDGNFEVVSCCLTLLCTDIDKEQDDTDSACGESIYSDTTSVASSIYRGITHHGRRYQTTREGDYWGPSDEKQ